MQVTCSIEGHFKAPVILICTNPNCDKSRLLCVTCLGSKLHNNCFDSFLHVDSIFKKDFLLNQNWIQNKNLKRAIGHIEQYKLLNGPNQILEKIKAQIEKECEDLIEHFKQEVNKQKNQILSSLQKRVDLSDINVNDFMGNFRNIYNFDSLISLLQQIQDETDNIQNQNMNLDAFFKKIAQDEQQNTQLEIKANLLNSKIQKYLEVTGKKSFEKLKEIIPFKKLTEYFDPPPGNWSWNPSKKSVVLTLNENNMLVRNETAVNNNFYAVLGSLEMKEGRHKWSIEILNINGNQWICFGVVETQHVNNLENFPTNNGIGLTTTNQRHKMVGDQNLHDYKNKVLICDLNLDDGTFQISCDNILLAREQNNLKNKTLVPYIILYHKENSAKLQIL